jgi:hypothetical protein
MSEQTKGFFATNWFRLFIAAFALVLLLIYFERESQLDACIQQVRLNYDTDWNFQCKEAKKDINCTLPRLNAEAIENTRAKRAGECIQRYSFK